jgi:hypothetical protein
MQNMQTYTIKPTTAEEFHSGFIAQAIKITGEPCYNDIRQLRTVIYENAASYNTPLGGGNHGHLGMVMPALTYDNVSLTPWVDPPEPAADVIIEQNAPTAAQIAKAHRTHSQALKARREFQNLDRALTRVIIEAIEPLYLKPFHGEYIGLLGKTTKQLLESLITSYGYILPQELEANYAQLSKPYDATQEPLQLLIERFEEATTFASDGQLPIAEGQLINSGIVALKNTGVLERFIDQWTDKPRADRSTWLQFKDHFQPRVLEYQKGRRGTATPQYGMMMDHFQPHIITPSSSQDTSELLMQANNAAMANMAATQNELLQQLADMQEKFATMATKTHNMSNNDATPIRKGGKQATTYVPGNPGNKDPNGYCWTHGYNVAHGHNSATCKRRATGHQATATRLDNQGGTQTDKPTK